MRTLADRAEIIRACEALFAPGQIVELRGLDATTRSYLRRHTVAGYFDDFERLASAAAGLDARGVYVTLNPLNPALLSRAANRLIDVGPRDPLTADGDVTARRWLPIDLDPTRPAGVSASDAEHRAALDRADAVRGWLREQGWPDPLFADSGNGAHLLYRVELPADDGGLIAAALKALAARFDDAAVKVDQKVFNPARIWKLYGTIAAKGDSTADRPHRRSRLIGSAPEDAVTQSGLEALAGLCGRAEKPAKASSPELSAGRFDLDAWIAAHALDVEGPRPWDGEGRRWVFRACPWNEEHKGSAFIVQRANGALAAGCHHNSCAGWGWRELRARVETPRSANALATEDAETAPRSLSPLWQNRSSETATCDPSPYVIHDNRMWKRTFATQRDGALTEVSRRVIADFAVRIVEEARGEDGSVAFTLAGATAAGAPMRVTLSVEDFIAEKGLLAAVTAAAGASCGVRAGMTGCLRPAIQALSTDVAVTRGYQRAGWAEADGAWRFLLPGRAVAGVTARLRKLPYGGPHFAAEDTESFDSAPLRSGCSAGATEDGYARAVNALRSLLRSLQPERTTVIAALVFQAPLARGAGWLSDRYGVFVAGRTGSLKTSFCQALMCVWGAGFADDQYLLKFGEGATRNALLSYAEQARDLPFFVDNYKPNTGDGARGLVNLLHNLIEGSGRERLNRESELQAGRPIGCWPLLTGEDAPRGDAASLARLLVVPVRWAGGHNAALAEAQAAADELPRLGAAWLDWLESAAGQAAAARARGAFVATRAKWAERLRVIGPAGGAANPLRLAANLASNELTWAALAEHPLLGDVAFEFAAAHAAGLALLAGEMARQTAENVEAARFVDVLQQLLASGAARLINRGESRTCEDVIGWRAPDGGAYLLPDLARRAVEQALGGDGLNRVSNDALYGQLEELGLVGSHDTGRRTLKFRSGDGMRVRVLHLTGEAVRCDEEAEGE